jgi:phosphoribosylglycinamide formyltransferase-1
LKRIAVFCSGFGSNFEALCRAVRRGKLKAELALMVSDNPKATAIRRAAHHGVPVLVLSPRLFKTREAYERCVR